jgi:hypothetical protein
VKKKDDKTKDMKKMKDTRNWKIRRALKKGSKRFLEGVE